MLQINVLYILVLNRKQIIFIHALFFSKHCLTLSVFPFVYFRVLSTLHIALFTYILFGQVYYKIIVDYYKFWARDQCHYCENAARLAGDCWRL